MIFINFIGFTVSLYNYFNNVPQPNWIWLCWAGLNLVLMAKEMVK